MSKSMKIVVALLVASVIVRVDVWIAMFSGPRTFSISTCLNTLVLLLDIIGIWLMVRRKRVTRTFMIGSTLFDIAASVWLAVVRGWFSMSHVAILVLDLAVVFYFLFSQDVARTMTETFSLSKRRVERLEEWSLYQPKTWNFWRNMAIYFCVFSVVGHWLEIPYCMFNSLFGIVDAESLVWDNPMYPFMVYGFGVIACALGAFPLRMKLIEENRSILAAAAQFYLFAVLLALVMELGMGLLLNQPVDGAYPLWDNSQLPMNILGQAWLVNDILLGGVVLVFTWLVFPACERLFARVPSRIMDAIALVTVSAFIVLCVIVY